MHLGYDTYSKGIPQRQKDQDHQLLRRQQKKGSSGSLAIRALSINDKTQKVDIYKAPCLAVERSFPYYSSLKHETRRSCSHVETCKRPIGSDNFDYFSEIRTRVDRPRTGNYRLFCIRWFSHLRKESVETPQSHRFERPCRGKPDTRRGLFCITFCLTTLK